MSCSLVVNLFPPFLQVWKQEIVALNLANMLDREAAEFIQIDHRCHVNPCIVLMEEHFLLCQMGTFFL